MVKSKIFRFLIMSVLVLFGISLIRTSFQNCIPKRESRPLEQSIKPDDSDMLNVLAYNIQMRPQNLFADGQSQRSVLIAEQLKHYQDMYDIDVIIFSEAFDDKATEQLLKKLYALSDDRWYKTKPLGGGGFIQNGGVMCDSFRSKLGLTQSGRQLESSLD